MAIRIIQVGSGGWGESWLQLVHESKDCELVALVSRGGANMEKAKAAWKIRDEKCFTNLEKALDRDADLVIVTVPHHLHIEIAQSAMNAGKNVLIEKPLSDDFSKAKDFAAFVRHQPRQAWVSQNFRNREQLWDMRACLAPEGAGRPLFVNVQFRQGDNTKDILLWRREGWRGAQWSFLVKELVIHHFDMLRFLLQREPTMVRANGWSLPWSRSVGPEVLSAQIEFEKGVQVTYFGTADGLGMQTGYQAHWFVQTDKGSLRWEGNGILLDAGVDEHPQLLKAPEFPGFDRKGVLNDVVKGVQGLPCHVPTVADNLRSMAIVEATARSVMERRDVWISELLDGVIL